MKRVILSVVAVGALAGAAVMLRAQDPVKVDTKHYTVVFENDQVRVLKAHYGPGEKSEMHSHPNSVAVFLTDAKGKFNFPDGKSEEFNEKAGDVIWNKATVHQPENAGDKDFDVVLVELKGKGKHSAK
jgi:quercetin dioxygenase-like cupin family protein